LIDAIRLGPTHSSAKCVAAHGWLCVANRLRRRVAVLRTPREGKAGQSLHFICHDEIHAREPPKLSARRGQRQERNSDQSKRKHDQSATDAFGDDGDASIMECIMDVTLTTLPPARAPTMRIGG
jgi:hypothetical protein